MTTSLRKSEFINQRNNHLLDHTPTVSLRTYYFNNMIKIGDILDSLFLPEPSIYPERVQPQSARTVRHCPQHYEARRESTENKTENMNCIIKTEASWNERKCPNVEIRNGVICAFERRKTPETNTYRSRKRKGVKGEERKEKEVNDSVGVELGNKSK